MTDAKYGTNKQDMRQATERKTKEYFRGKKKNRSRCSTGKFMNIDGQKVNFSQTKRRVRQKEAEIGRDRQKEAERGRGRERQKESDRGIKRQREAERGRQRQREAGGRKDRLEPS